jgi:hypothetical protein
MLLLLLLVACEPTGYSDSVDYDSVDYDLSCENVTCYGADDESTFETDGSTAMDCTWYCADYQGARSYVAITWWSWDGECYVEESVYVSDCI